MPLPVGAAQLVLAWLAARNVRPPVGRLAAVVLGAVCLISVLAGMFDGDLIDNVASDGVFSWGVVWGVVLLAVTAAVGLLAAARARQLYRRPGWPGVVAGRSGDAYPALSSRSPGAG